jgi:hypothetical protein
MREHGKTVITLINSPICPFYEGTVSVYAPSTRNLMDMGRTGGKVGHAIIIFTTLGTWGASATPGLSALIAGSVKRMDASRSDFFLDRFSAFA